MERELDAPLVLSLQGYLPRELGNHPADEFEIGDAGL